jgi:dynamin 1-like protein|eukprot:Stramenopile-MAST_4_protein_3266
MNNLIPIINKLQDVFNAIGESPIDLPQIVVVGSQSSGKSSVLESIVGREFLPRGSGIVTRRPLVIQLYNCGSDGDEAAIAAPRAAGDDSSQEWGEFLHLPGQKFFDFDEIRTEIQRETDRLTGKNKGISKQSINLKIFSPHVLTLSMVDLPGTTKIAVGDQPDDIEKLIVDMCKDYISNPLTIVLAVTAANTDLANSDALKLAKEVDPSGDRTIGVLTKLDLMDAGTDAMDMINGRVINLRRGFVGVVNRSQQAIKDCVTIRESLATEQTFFENHPAYRTVSGKMGIPFLSRMLNDMLMRHIRDCLPDLKSKITTMLIELDTELQNLGRPFAAQDRNGKGEQLLHLISTFATNFNDAIEGRSRGTIEVNELYGGARVAYIFKDVFAKHIQGVDPFECVTDMDIRTAIRNATGTRASLFVPEVSFELLVKDQIKRLEQPAQQCVDLVYDELQRVASQCESPEIERFSNLRDQIVDVVNNMLRNRLVPTQNMITNLIMIELAHINTGHPDFIGGSRAVAQLMERMHRETAAKQRAENGPPKDAFGGYGGTEGQMPRQPPTEKAGMFDNLFKDFTPGSTKSSVATPGGIVKLPQMPSSVRQPDAMTDRERMEVDIIKSLIASYFSIVRKNIGDLVPKTVMHFLVNYAKEHVQSVLVQRLYRDSSLDDLLRETDTVAQRRRNCSEVQGLLRRALEIVNEVRDFNASS